MNTFGREVIYIYINIYLTTNSWLFYAYTRQYVPRCMKIIHFIQDIGLETYLTMITLLHDNEQAIFEIL